MKYIDSRVLPYDSQIEARLKPFTLTFETAAYIRVKSSINGFYLWDGAHTPCTVGQDFLTTNSQTMSDETRKYLILRQQYCGVIRGSTVVLDP